MWPRSLVGRRPTDICEARVRIPSKCESYQAFFPAIAFTAAFLQISYLKFYNYGNLISRVLNFAIVVRRYFAGLHIRDFSARPATMKCRHAMRTNFFFWLGSDRTIWVTFFFNFVKEKSINFQSFKQKYFSMESKRNPSIFYEINIDTPILWSVVTVIWTILRWLETVFREAYWLHSKRSKTDFPSSQSNQFLHVVTKELTFEIVDVAWQPLILC